MEQVVTKQEDIIVFQEGIPGFEHLKRFIMLEQGDGVFYYLQSVEEGITFPIVNPYLLKADYAPTIHESYFEKLGGGNSSDYTLYVIATIGSTIEESTVNLRGPLLIQVEKRIGIQAIIEDKGYFTQHKIKDLMSVRGVEVC